MGKRLMVAVLVSAAACSECSKSSDGPAGAAASDPVLGNPFVVFTRETMVLDRLGVPVPLPVTVGSTVSSRTVASDAPDIVAVTDSGELVAVRNGTATVRTTSGPQGSLRVEVHAADALAVVPEVLQMRPGSAATLRLVDGDGNEVPATAVVWATSDPGTAVAANGQVVAGAQRGRTVLTATYGGQSARLTVTVGATGHPAPETASVRR